jgi:hypothetical protein
LLHLRQLGADDRDRSFVEGKGAAMDLDVGVEQAQQLRFEFAEALELVGGEVFLREEARLRAFDRAAGRKEARVAGESAGSGRYALPRHSLLRSLSWTGVLGVPKC